MRIKNFRNRISIVCYTFNSNKLIMIILNWLSISWESFLQGVSVHSKLPIFDRFKVDCIKEKSRLNIWGISMNFTKAINNHHPISQKRKDQDYLWKERGKGYKWKTNIQSGALVGTVGGTTIKIEALLQKLSNEMISMKR